MTKATHTFLPATELGPIGRKLGDAAMKNALRRSRLLGAATMVSLLTVGGASAATLGLGGDTVGTTITLPNTFDVVATGLTPGTTQITYFDSSNGTGGLYVTPNDVNITFEYIGKEAGYLNQSRFVVGNVLMFDTNQTPIQTTGAIHYVLGSNPGAVPFLFDTVTGGNLAATNGGAVQSPLRIAFAKLSDTVWYALFDDGGGGQDHDYDDMVLRITVSSAQLETSPTPLPGAIWLLGTVLAGGFGAGRWRKRKARRIALNLATA